MLVEAIRNRTIGIICPGHSLKTFEKRIQEFKDFDWCWVSINYPERTEEILDKIGKEVDVVVMYGPEVLNRNMVFMNEYQHRGVIVTHTNRFDRCYLVPPGGGNSTSAFIHQCIQGKFTTKIYLFGADGYSGRKHPYYKKWKSPPMADWQQITQHKGECKRFNEAFPDGTSGIDIINVSPKSHYTPFKKISYDELLNENRDGRRGN